MPPNSATGRKLGLTRGDATVIRALLVPALMRLFGDANWWMPEWLGRRLPELHVEGHPEDHLTTVHA